MIIQTKGIDQKHKDPTLFNNEKQSNQGKNLQGNEFDSQKSYCQELVFPLISQNDSICFPKRKNIWVPSGPNIKRNKPKKQQFAYSKEPMKQIIQLNQQCDKEKQKGQRQNYSSEHASMASQQGQNSRFHRQEMRPSLRQISPQKQINQQYSQNIYSEISLIPAKEIKSTPSQQAKFGNNEYQDSRGHLQPDANSRQQKKVINKQQSKICNPVENSNNHVKSITDNNNILDSNQNLPKSQLDKLENYELQNEFLKSFQKQQSLQQKEPAKNIESEQKNNGNIFTRKAAQEFWRINTFRRTRIALKSLIFLIRFWKITKRNIILKRQAIMCKYTPEYLKLSVESAMDFSQNCMYQQLVQLFMEPMSLEYNRDLRQNLSKNAKLKKLRLRKHTWDILEALAVNGEKLINSQFPFIDFIESQINSGRYLFNGLFPVFIINRLQFNSYGRLDSLMGSQREIIGLFFFLIYGPFNRLVDPWQVMSLDKSLIKAKNAQLVLSCLFYLFRDYIYEYCPIRYNALSKTLPNYKPIPRSKPLNSYSSILQYYPLFQEMNGTPMIENINKELNKQCFLNDNIVIGLYPRNKLEDLITQDEQLRLHCRQCFSKISLFLLTQVKAFEQEHLLQQDNNTEKQ